MPVSATISVYGQSIENLPVNITGRSGEFTFAHKIYKAIIAQFIDHKCLCIWIARKNKPGWQLVLVTG